MGVLDVLQSQLPTASRDELGQVEGIIFDGDFYAAQLRRLGLSPGEESLCLHYVSKGPLDCNPNRLFDTRFYLAQCPPSVSQSGVNPLAHYLAHGAREGLSPHPLFDTKYYLANHPDVAGCGLNPLVHYLVYGEKELRKPNIIFDPSFYQQRYGSNAFAAEHPLQHFLSADAEHGCDPSPLFSTRYYLGRYPEVAEAGENPLTHFMLRGASAGYATHPLFDVSLYLRRAGAGAEANPLVHFLEVGAKLGISPCALFDPIFYTASQPGLALQNAFTHYVARGAKERSSPHPLFNVALYAERNPNVPAESLLAHYLEAPPEARSAINSGSLVPLAVQVRDLMHVAEHERWHLPSVLTMPSASAAEVSVVIPVHNKLDLTLACLRALARAEPKLAYETIVIDDASTDDTASVLANKAGIRYLRNDVNLGFVRSCNRAAAEAKGRYVLFLNNDTLPLTGFLTKLLATFSSHEGVGLVGSMLIYPDGRLQEAGGVIWRDGSGRNYGRDELADGPEYQFVRDVDYCSGASILIERALLERLGGFDKRYAPAYYEDTDLAFRVRELGYRVLYQPESQVVHIEGASSGTDLSSGVKRHQLANQRIFAARWGRTIASHGTSKHPPKNFQMRTRKKHLLFVDATTPTPDRDSGSIDALALMRLLLKLGYHVIFAPNHGLAHAGEYTRALQQLGVECWYRPFLNTAEDLLKRRGDSLDIVLLARWAIAGPLVEHVRAHAPQAKIVFDTVDLHHLREAREAKLRGSEKLKAEAARTEIYELSIVRRVDHTLVRSEQEKALLAAEGIHSVTALPLIRPIVTTKAPFDQRWRILFVGGFSHPPNVDAVAFLVDEIWPLVRAELPDACLTIVGSNAPKSVLGRASESVEVLGFVADLDEILSQTRVNVAPLRFGAGLKGKVAGALCGGVPTVLTRLAAEGMDLVHGSDAFIANDPAAFAAAVVRLYQSPALWEQVSNNGLALARRNHSEHSAEKLLRPLFDPEAPTSLVARERKPARAAGVARPVVDRNQEAFSQWMRRHRTLSEKVLALAEALHEELGASVLIWGSPVVGGFQLSSDITLLVLVDRLSSALPALLAKHDRTLSENAAVTTLAELAAGRVYCAVDLARSIALTRIEQVLLKRHSVLLKGQECRNAIPDFDTALALTMSMDAALLAELPQALAPASLEAVRWMERSIIDLTRSLAWLEQGIPLSKNGALRFALEKFAEHADVTTVLRGILERRSSDPSLTRRALSADDYRKFQGSLCALTSKERQQRMKVIAAWVSSQPELAAPILQVLSDQASRPFRAVPTLTHHSDGEGA